MFSMANCRVVRRVWCRHGAYAVFERLPDAAFFSLARADHGTVAWPGGIDR
jgi:hypothetical protein